MADDIVSVPGLDVPAAALQLLLQLVDDGFTLLVDEGKLTVRPKPDAATATQIRKYKGPILGMLAYEADDAHLRVDEHGDSGV